jgi:hypothetical protein
MTIVTCRIFCLDMQELFETQSVSVACRLSTVAFMGKTHSILSVAGLYAIQNEVQVVLVR